jgi:hypothetical protein
VTETSEELQYPEHFAPELVSELGQYRLVLTPSPLQLCAVLKLAHFASLAREEQSSLRFALALLPTELLEFHGNSEWAPIKFERDRPATVAEVAKLAPALDHRHMAIALTLADSGLRISGIVRTSLDRYRMARAEAAGASDIAFGYLRVTVDQAGAITVGVHTDVLATLLRGTKASAPLPVLLREGPVRRALTINAAGMNATTHGAVADLYALNVLGLLQAVSESTHGGTLAILPDTSALASTKYACTSDDLQRALISHWSLEVRLNARPNGSVESTLFQSRTKLQDCVRATGHLAAVDGALILGPDFRILGFGGMFELEESQVACLRSFDVEGKNSIAFDLSAFGARHRSAACFAWQRPNSVVFVASEDGPVACFVRPPASAHVLLWRPIALTWFDPPMMKAAAG